MERVYKTDIIARDGPCRFKDKVDTDCYGPIDIHHRKTIATGGTDERNNLGATCRHHHITVAHGIDQEYRHQQFNDYVMKIPRPDYWDQIMIISTSQRIEMKQAQRDRDKKRRNSQKISVDKLVKKLDYKKLKPEKTAYQQQKERCIKKFGKTPYQMQRDKQKEYLQSKRNKVE